MANAWVVRAGSGGRHIDEFEKGYVGLNYDVREDLSGCEEKSEVVRIYSRFWPDARPGRVMSSASQLYRFLKDVKVGDQVLTYDGEKREFLLGKIDGSYLYSENTLDDFIHLRPVKWGKRFSRDELSTSARNSLGSALALFSVDSDVWEEIQGLLEGEKKATADSVLCVASEGPDLEQIYEDTVERAHELLKDRILALDSDEMEVLVAEILKAMGYKAKVSPKGSDRGVDVFASRDGLGFEEPRIKAEVKHRPKNQMGSPELRSFIAGLRQGDRGMYVSTGGFTREAKYEADRATVPVSMVDLDELASLVVTNYESFDFRGRTLIKLTKVYWPVD